MRRSSSSSCAEKYIIIVVIVMFDENKGRRDWSVASVRFCALFIIMAATQGGE